MNRQPRRVVLDRAYTDFLRQNGANRISEGMALVLGAEMSTAVLPQTQPAKFCFIIYSRLGDRLHS
jgi:hypothetical protein